MKVLFVTHYSQLYGANRSLLALMDGLDKNHISPFVLLPRSGDLINELDNRGISYFVLPFKAWLAESRSKFIFRLITNLLLLPMLIWKIKRLSIDLIYTNSSITPIGAWTAFLTGRPHIWHVREFGWEDYKLKYDLGRKHFEIWMNEADHVIAVSKSIKNKVLRNIKAPITVVYNGVISKGDTEKISRVRNEKTGAKIIFGIIGLLSNEKGQDQAIKAFSKIHRKYPYIELWLAGTGSKEYENYLNKLTAEYEILDKVKFLGYVKDPFNFYSKIDVALICSKNEGMGRVTAEAMVAGKIIIGLDNAGTGELLDNYYTGLLYDGNVESLSSKLEVAIINDLKEMQENARIKGLNNFLIEDYANKIYSIILKMKK